MSLKSVIDNSVKGCDGERERGSTVDQE